jgi:hypothetical protein
VNGNTGFLWGAEWRGRGILEGKEGEGRKKGDLMGGIV